MDCLNLIKDKINSLKEELGINKDVENWENVSVSIRKIKSGKKYLKSIIIQTITPNKTPRGQVVYIKTYPEQTPKEEIQQTEEYKKTKELSELIKAYKVLKDVLQ